MEDYTDYIEFMRPEGKKIRIVFEMYRGEVLFYHYEYQHNKNGDWKPMIKNNEQLFTYFVKDENGVETEQHIAFPTIQEMKYAHETIAQRNYGHSV